MSGEPPGRREASGRSRGRRTLRRIALVLAGLAGLVVVVLLAAGGWLTWRVRASLPVVEGQRRLPGLGQPVEIARDAGGVPLVRGAGRLDVARATGWLHAQERLFQMDVLRRAGAGEIAELVGPAALPLDRAARRHRFRARAPGVLARATPDTRALLAAYAEGVNAGMQALGAPPPEYLALRARPEPWGPEDTLVVLWAMYLNLQGGHGAGERARGVMRDTLPPGLVAFLVPPGTDLDAPLVGGPPAPVPIPPPEVVDLRRQAPETGAPEDIAPPQAGREATPPHAAGSNAWAVAGGRTASGDALLANDVHLTLELPNIWYRVALAWPGDDGTERHLVGVTLPGTPVLVTGSTGRVAWGFTNSYADLADLVVVEPVAGRPGHYHAPGGPRPFDTVEETIEVRGAPPETLEITATVWGPLVEPDHRGRPLALRWVAHEPAAVDAELAGMERMRDVDGAVALAPRVGMPTQNLVVADRTGRVAWTLIGPLVRRRGFDGRVPVSWADGSRGWDGLLPPEDYPRVVDPPDGLVWTANNRVAGLADTGATGDGGHALGARARQIRDRLRSLDRATPERMLELQLDDRALLLARWRELLLEVLDGRARAGDPERAELRRVVEDEWTGRASVDSAAYRLVRGFRLEVARDALGALTAPCRDADPGFNVFAATRQWEGPLWRLVTERPAHLLAPAHDDWRAALLAAADTVAERLGRRGPLAERVWGERNTVAIGHPLSRAVPRLASWLDLPPRPLPGDRDMPRVQGVRFGATQRMVVSPGREQHGLFHMPGGQSGHFLSPWYRAGHDAWAGGEPAPLLPGPAAHVLRLVPR